MTILLPNIERPRAVTILTPDGTTIQAPHDDFVFDGILPASGDYTIHVTRDTFGPLPTVQGQPITDSTEFMMLVAIR